MIRFTFLFLFLPLVTSAQAHDSLRLANDSLDRRIAEMVAEWERNEVDYIFMRSYDSTGLFANRFHFLFRKDTCTIMHEFHIWEGYTIHDVHIGRIEARRRTYPPPCFDEIARIERDLSAYEDYFQNSPIPYPDFHLSPYTIYGHINGKYILQRFGEDFISSFHSGLLYDTVCRDLGCWCSH